MQPDPRWCVCVEGLEEVSLIYHLSLDALSNTNFHSISTATAAMCIWNGNCKYDWSRSMLFWFHSFKMDLIYKILLSVGRYYNECSTWLCAECVSGGMTSATRIVSFFSLLFQQMTRNSEFFYFTIYILLLILILSNKKAIKQIELAKKLISNRLIYN